MRNNTYIRIYICTYIQLHRIYIYIYSIVDKKFLNLISFVPWLFIWTLSHSLIASYAIFHVIIILYFKNLLCWQSRGKSLSLDLSNRFEGLANNARTSIFFFFPPWTVQFPLNMTLLKLKNKDNNRFCERFSSRSKWKFHTPGNSNVTWPRFSFSCHILLFLNRVFKLRFTRACNRVILSIS